MSNEYYFEQMEGSELAFLAKTARKDGRIYQRLLIVLLLGCVLISFGGGWRYLVKGDITVFSWKHYWFTLALLATICYLAVRFSRSRGLSRIHKDLKQQKKVVEKTLIRKKTFLPQNNTYHFYLDSASKLSIEVQEADFNAFTEGDEINIEYSLHAGIYFGYF